VRVVLTFFPVRAFVSTLSVLHPRTFLPAFLISRLYPCVPRPEPFHIFPPVCRLCGRPRFDMFLDFPCAHLTYRLCGLPSFGAWFPRTSFPVTTTVSTNRPARRAGQKYPQPCFTSSSAISSGRFLFLIHTDHRPCRAPRRVGPNAKRARAISAITFFAPLLADSLLALSTRCAPVPTQNSALLWPDEPRTPPAS